MNINDAFPSNYLKASDLGDGTPLVTIDRVDLEPVGRTKEMKPVVYFAGKQKGLILNKTNSKKIADIAESSDTDDWHGIQITLFATEVDFQGETVEAIRVKAPKRTAATPARRAIPARAAAPVPADEPEMEPITDDDIPF